MEETIGFRTFNKLLSCSSEVRLDWLSSDRALSMAVETLSYSDDFATVLGAVVRNLTLYMGKSVKTGWSSYQEIGLDTGAVPTSVYVTLKIYLCTAPELT
jgi:hypothetical protein